MIEQVNLMFAYDAGQSRGEGAIRCPDVGAHLERLVVRAHDAVQLPARTRIGQAQIHPARRRGEGQRGLPRAGADGVGKISRRQRLDQGGGTVALVKHVRETVGIGDVVHEKVRREIIARPVRQHGLDQFVNLDAVDERQVGRAEVVHMLEGRLVFDELALERRGENPLRHLRLAGRDVAQIGPQARLRGVGANLAADDLEINEQPLFILDDLGLSRSDAEIARRPGPDVFGDQTEGERFGRLDLVRKRIVRIDIAGLEIAQLQARLGIDGNGRGEQRHHDLFAIVDIAQRTADAIDHRRMGGGIAGGNEEILGRAAAQSGHHAGARHVAQAGHDRRTHDKQFTRRVAAGVAHIKGDAEAGDGVAGIVVDLQRALEGRAGQDGLLIDLDAHARTDPPALRTGAGGSFGRRRAERRGCGAGARPDVITDGPGNAVEAARVRTNDRSVHVIDRAVIRLAGRKREAEAPEQFAQALQAAASGRAPGRPHGTPGQRPAGDGQRRALAGAQAHPRALQNGLQQVTGKIRRVAPIAEAVQ